MATIQARKSRGRKYWYIVESRRINGKPRPITLCYLGKAEDLLDKLKNGFANVNLKSYSHGAVAVLIKIADELAMCNVLNNYVASSRKYMAKKPIRNNITAGATMLLAAIGRTCCPTSKKSWYEWAKNTSLEYLLRSNFSKVDSQHFWDMMDSFPIEKIEHAEETILKKAFELYGLEQESTLFDTTNFFTYIESTNEKCTIAQRGKNKQKRRDLRQIGLAMAVTQNDMIPIFHLTYKGNMHDSKVFAEIVTKLKGRILALGLDTENHTIVFDRGNNSKKNMERIKNEKLHYVGALTPSHHCDLIKEAKNNWETRDFDGKKIQIYRSKKEIWNEERTVVIFISSELKDGQIRGMYQNKQKAENILLKLQKSLQNPKTKKREKNVLENMITKVLKKQFIKNIFEWSLEEVNVGRYKLHYFVNKETLQKIEDQMGFRIIMTDRHEWDSLKIIKTYYGQSYIEHTFKDLKNPYHLAIRPQFHWTDQKIAVHFFTCVIGYLLSAIVWKQAKITANFSGSLDTLFDKLNDVRLACCMKKVKKHEKIDVTYKLEDMDKDEKCIMDALKISDIHQHRLKISGVGVYN